MYPEVEARLIEAVRILASLRRSLAILVTVSPMRNMSLTMMFLHPLMFTNNTMQVKAAKANGTPVPANMLRRWYKIMIDDPAANYKTLTTNPEHLSLAADGEMVSTTLIEGFYLRQHASARAITTTRVHDPAELAAATKMYQAVLRIATKGVPGDLIGNADETPNYHGPGKISRTIGMTGDIAHSAHQVPSHDSRHTVMPLLLASGAKAPIFSIFKGPDSGITQHKVNEVFRREKPADRGENILDDVKVENAVLLAAGYDDEDPCEPEDDDLYSEEGEENDAVP